MIPRKQFNEIFTLIKKQHKKDMRFADFMESYLDGRCVPTLNDDFGIALEKLLFATVESNEILCDTYDSNKSWYSWFAYECDFGNHPMECLIDLQPFTADSIDSFYNIMCAWEIYSIKKTAEQNKSIAGTYINVKKHNICKYCEKYTKNNNDNCKIAEQLYQLSKKGIEAPVIKCKEYEPRK